MLRKKLNKAILKNSTLLLLIACLSKCNPQDQGENFNPLFKYFRNFVNENIHPIFNTEFFQSYFCHHENLNPIFHTKFFIQKS